MTMLKMKGFLVKITMLAACVWTLLAAAGLPSNRLLAAELSLPKVGASSGDTVTASVEYRAHGAAVSTLQFDLAYDQAAAERNLTITFSVGSAATAAGKTLAANPNFGPGVIRFLILGVNQNVIADGSLVDLTIEVFDEFPPDTLGLHVFNVVCASPQADFVPCRAHDGQIRVKK